MKIKHVWRKVFIAFIGLLMVCGQGASWAQEEVTRPTGILVKISKLEKTLNAIDGLIQAGSHSPTAQLRGMLMGMEWIDPSRSIVMRCDFNSAQPSMAALIPFQRHNQNFQMAYQANAGPDYYILTVPPGGTVSDAVKAVLVDASGARATASLSVELDIRELLNKFDAQIMEGLNQLESFSQGPIAPQFGPKPKDVKAMLLGMLEMAEQLDSLSMGLDLSADTFTVSYEAIAEDGTELFTLMTHGGKTSFLDAYKPNYQMNYRCRSHDMTGMLDLLNRWFGQIYSAMGIDFAGMTAVFESFTGEMRGGVSFKRDGLDCESITVLKESVNALDFLDKVYVPWMMKYSKDMTEMMKNQLGEKMEDLFVRTEDSTVAGHRVIGVKSRFPLMGMTTGMPHAPSMERMINCEMRMTVVGNLLLTASHDKRISELIRIAKRLKEVPSQGPLMTMDIDMASYLDFIKDTVPNLPGLNRPLPKLGRATFVADLEEGRASMQFSVKTHGVKKLIAYFKKVELPYPDEELDEEPEAEAEAGEVDFAQDWFEKGMLYSTYGNHKEAIRCFDKVIELFPENSNAYFNQGISYGEMGEYEKAISSLDKALELSPESGLYFYGRGRVYLLSGDKEKAIEDFKRAAALGNRDARDYLENE
ncbi:MAG: tetratricopeptide repeat protein [Deltaproteobacteria bacterium]|nr:tetratricopeptide repeat protein [Deltaproteobacteria bacterium]